MEKFEVRRRGLLIGAAAMLVSPIAMARAEGVTGAIAPIQRLNEGLLQIMKDGSHTPFRERFDTLAPIIDQTFDLSAILQESVGLSWNSLPSNQQAMLSDAFRRYTVASYVNSFDNFNGQRFEISPDVRSVGKEQVVETHIIPRRGESHVLDYVMRQTPSGWRVVDVLADGSISRVAVQRSDFRQILNRGGAQALTESLRIKSADLSGEAA